MPVKQKYHVNQGFYGWYDGKERVGIIKKVTDKYIVVFTADGYRTFVIAKIQ